MERNVLRKHTHLLSKQVCKVGLKETMCRHHQVFTLFGNIGNGFVHLDKRTLLFSKLCILLDQRLVQQEEVRIPQLVGLFSKMVRCIIMQCTPMVLFRGISRELRVTRNPVDCEAQRV